MRHLGSIELVTTPMITKSRQPQQFLQRIQAREFNLKYDFFFLTTAATASIQYLIKLSPFFASAH